MNDSLDKINALLAMMKENDIVELELQEGDFSVALRKQGAFVPPPASGFPMSMMPGMAAMPPAPIAPVAAPASAAPASADAGLTPIKSPIVGTFYRSPSPEAPPFVQVGDVVKKDTVVCIIEAMKIMNEIRAEQDGKIEKVVAEGGEPVEYGQPLVLISKS